SAWVRVYVGPIYLSAARIWLALAFLCTALSGRFGFGRSADVVSLWLPNGTVGHYPVAAALLGGVLLLAGLGTRYVAMALVVGISAAAMMDLRQTDDIYLLMMLAMIAIYGAGQISADALIEAALKHR